jgi:hypothetical protein
MPLFCPAQHKWLEESVYLATVILLASVTTAARGWLRWARCCLAVLALIMAWAQMGRAQEGIACTINAAAVDTGRVLSMREFPGSGVLIRAAKGWFLARTVNGAGAVNLISNVNTGSVSAMRDFPAGVLIGTLNGLLLALVENGAVTVDSASNADTGTVQAMRDLPEGGVLIRAAKGWFVARIERLPSIAPAMRTPGSCGPCMICRAGEC